MPKKSRDQQRKDKLVKRKERDHKLAKASPFFLAYEGNRYKTDHYTPLFLLVETAIGQVDQATRGSIEDRAVADALAGLVTQIRRRELTPLDPASPPSVPPGDAVAFLQLAIRAAWSDEVGQSFSTEDKVGILRTLINSVNIWSIHPTGAGRGYLAYLKGFLSKIGGPSAGSSAATGGADEAQESLYDVGAEYCETLAPAARKELMDFADELIADGEYEYVAETAQMLIGVYGQGPALPLLSAMSIRALKAMRG